MDSCINHHVHDSQKLKTIQMSIGEYMFLKYSKSTQWNTIHQ